MPKPRCKTPKFRCAFVNLVNPKPDKKGVVKHEVTMIFPEGTDFDARMGADPLSINEMIEEAIVYGVQKKWGGVRPKKLNLPIKSSDTDAGDWTGFEPGTKYAKAWTGEDNPPAVFDQGKNKVTDTTTIYAGSWCRASIEAGAWENDGNKGVSLYLCGIQKIDDDEPFTGRRSADDDFDVIDPTTAPEVSSADIPF